MSYVRSETIVNINAPLKISAAICTRETQIAAIVSLSLVVCKTFRQFVKQILL